MKFGEKLTKLRKEKGLSQEELAEKLNVTRQTISKWELDYTAPDMENMKKIADCFEMSVSDLIEENTKSSSKEKSQGNSLLKIIIISIIVIVAVYWIFNILLAHFIIGTGLKNYNNAMDQINEQMNKISEENAAMDADANSNENMQGNYNSSFTESHVSTHTETSNVNGVETTSSSYSMTTTDNNGTNTYTNSYSGNDEQSKEEYEKDVFNNQFTTRFSGKRSGFVVQQLMDEIISSNKKNPNYIITVKFSGLESSEAEGLETMKASMSKSNLYNVTFETNTDGYIDQVVITK